MQMGSGGLGSRVGPGLGPFAEALLEDLRAADGRVRAAARGLCGAAGDAETPAGAAAPRPGAPDFGRPSSARLGGRGRDRPRRGALLDVPRSLVGLWSP